jgi:hypothetical protein
MNTSIVISHAKNSPFEYYNALRIAMSDRVIYGRMSIELKLDAYRKLKYLMMKMMKIKNFDDSVISTMLSL